MANLNSTTVYGSLLVTRDVKISQNLTIDGSIVVGGGTSTGYNITIDGYFVSSSLTPNTALYADGDKKIISSSVSSTELGYLDGVTSSIQTQLNGKSSTSHNHNLTDLSEKSYNSLTDKPSIAYASTIPADAFSSTEVGNLQANQLANGTTPWTSNNYYDDSDVDTHLSGSTGITYSSGTISNSDTGSSAVSSHETTYNHSNYNTAYSERHQWDGGSTNLTASTGRTSLGLSDAATTTVATIRSGTTASNVGLGNVTNDAQVKKAGDTMTGNLTIGSTTRAADSKLVILTDDAHTSSIELYGNSQGTGKVYVGQSTTYGGGIEYNGDGSPTTTGAGSDYIALWRRSSSIDYWTARNLHNSNDWEFRGAVTWDGGGSVNANSAYTHSNITSGNPHSVTKSDVGLGNVPNTNIAYSSTIDADAFNSTEVGNLQANQLADGTTPWTNYGTSAGTICEGNDSRLSDARTPVSHGNAYHDDNYYSSGDTISTTRIQTSNGTEIYIGAGETLGSITGTSEAVYLAGESGVFILSSSDNLSSGLDNSAHLVDSGGNSSFPGNISATGTITGSNINASNWDTAYSNTHVSGSDNQTISSGNGMNFTGGSGNVTIALGTPATLTSSTSNSVTANSHTHEISGISWLDLDNTTLSAASSDSTNDFFVYVNSSGVPKKENIETLLGNVGDTSVVIKKIEMTANTTNQTVFNVYNEDNTLIIPNDQTRVNVYVWGIKQPPGSFTIDDIDGHFITLEAGVDIGARVTIEWFDSLDNIVNIEVVAHASTHHPNGSDPLGSTTSIANTVAARNSNNGLESGYLKATGTLSSVNGSLYAGTTAPTDTTRLNYNGYFYATRVYNAVYNDLAEYFVKEKNTEKKKNYVYTLDKNGEAIVSYKRADKKVLGVYTNSPAFIMKQEYEEDGILIALSGTVETVYCGKINIGDEVVSYKEGKVVKANFIEKAFRRSSIIGKVVKVLPDNRLLIKV